MLRRRGRRKRHTRGALKAMRVRRMHAGAWGAGACETGSGWWRKPPRCEARKRARPHHARVQGEESRAITILGLTKLLDPLEASTRLKPQVIEHAAVAQIVRNLAPVANLRAISIRPRVLAKERVGALIFTVGADGVRDRRWRLWIVAGAEFSPRGAKIGGFRDAPNKRGVGRSRASARAQLSNERDAGSAMPVVLNTRPGRHHRGICQALRGAFAEKLDLSDRPDILLVRVCGRLVQKKRVHT